MNTFEIENGLLNALEIKDSNVILPDEVTGLEYEPFLRLEQSYTLTLSPNMKTSFSELLSAGITALNIPAGTKFECSDCAPNYSPFFVSLEEINVSPDNESCSSFNGMLLSKDGKILYACPAAHKGPIVIPETVVKIHDRAFYGCSLIKEIVVPESVTEVGERAFADCKSLSSINLPKSVEIIGKEAFLRCSKIVSAGPIPNTSDSKATKKKKKEYNFEFAWTSAIPDNTFEGMRKLKKVVFPDSMQKIGKNAFKDCKSLEEITIPETLTFDSKLFKDCKKLSVKTTAQKEFIIQAGYLNRYNGTNTEVTIPDEVSIVGSRAFDKTKVETVILPSSVTTVESEAFLGANIKHIVLNGELQKIGTYAFPNIISVAQDIFTKIAISTFSKADHYSVADCFIEHAADWNYDSKVYEQNLSFLGKHLLEKALYSTTFCELLVTNTNLLHEVLTSQAIPLKDVDDVIAHFSTKADTDPAFLAELIQYKETLMNSEKGQKWLAKEQKKEEDALFADASEMSVADARKLYKFKYSDGAAVITGCYTKEESWVVPAKIGQKNVRTLDRRSFNGNDILVKDEYYHQKEAVQKKTIVISEGISEIASEAFFCISNMEIYLPTTITRLPKYAFDYVSYLRIHIPESVTVLEEKCIVSDAQNPVTIIAPLGSCAEEYAKKYNIPFEAKN